MTARSIPGTIAARASPPPPRGTLLRHRLRFEAREPLADVGHEARLALLAVATMSMPSSACRRTTSATAWRTRASKAAASYGWPLARAAIMSKRSGGRARLPTWVVRIRSVLSFMPSPPIKPPGGIENALRRAPASPLVVPPYPILWGLSSVHKQHTAALQLPSLKAWKVQRRTGTHLTNALLAIKVLTRVCR